MAPIIKHGMGSSYDAGPWSCKCGQTNFPTRHLLFRLQKYFCSCGKKFNGNFRVSFDDIKVNGHNLLGKIHYNSKPNCVAYAHVHALQFMERLEAILMKQDPSLLEDLDPEELFDMLTKRLSEMATLGCSTTPIRDVKMVHTGLILKEVGLPSHRPEPISVHKVADVTVIAKDDFEGITTALAEGEALVSTFYYGKRLRQLKYGQIYKSYHAPKYLKDKKKKIAGHAVWLVGAGRENGVEYFDIVNSHRRFCVRRNSHKKIIKSGVGRIRASDLKSNVIRLSRVAADGDEWTLQPQNEIVLNQHNRQLMQRSKPFLLDADDEMEDEDLDSCMEEPHDQILVETKPHAARSRGSNGRCHRLPRKGIKIRRLLKWLW